MSLLIKFALVALAMGTSACFDTIGQNDAASSVSTIAFDLPKGNYAGYGIELSPQVTDGNSDTSKCTPSKKHAERHDGTNASKSIDLALKNGCSYLLVVNLGPWDAANPETISQPTYSNRYKDSLGEMIPASELTGGTIHRKITVYSLESGEALSPDDTTDLQVQMQFGEGQPEAEIPPAGPFQPRRRAPDPEPEAAPSVPPTPSQGQADKPTVFAIKAGTGSGPWNEASQPLTLKPGTELVIENQDDTPHQVHTGEWKQDVAPFPHGKLLRKGERQTFTVKAYNGPPLFDHIHPKTGKFHIKVVP